MPNLTLSELFGTYNDIQIRWNQDPIDPIWVAKDVCNALGIKWDGHQLDKFDEEEKGRVFIHTPGGNQDLLGVTEAGLYRLIFKSRKEGAKAFQRWVFHEVLPSLRKNGFYQVNLTPAEMLLEQAKQLVEVERRQKELEAKQVLEAQRTDSLQKQVQQHDAELDRVFKPDGDYYSIRGYAKLKGLNLTIDEARNYGKLSKQTFWR